VPGCSWRRPPRRPWTTRPSTPPSTSRAGSSSSWCRNRVSDGRTALARNCDHPELTRLLAEWQPARQLHPGDVGWFWRFGPEAVAGALRCWRRGDDVAAIGLYDEPDYLRLAFSPDGLADAELARRIVGDLGDTEYVDAPEGAVIRDLLTEWHRDIPWTPLHRDLDSAVEDPGVAVEIVTEATAAERVAVQRAAFEGSTSTLERWHAMRAAPVDRRCLLARDEDGNAVAAVTVWSAGAGRPGLLEPMGVHRDFRGVGHGRAIVIAAAAALREMGASAAVVETPSSNAGAVSTYRSAGFLPGRPTYGLRRSAA
jgi:ribosomal protein S18 acetylase RimI-like enzyme